MTDQIELKPITLDDLRKLEIQGLTREVVHGEWVEIQKGQEMAGKRHGKIAARLNYFLVDYTMKNPVGVVYADQTTYVLKMNDNQVDLVRVPDVSFVLKDRIDDENPDDFHHLAPDLAIEVISPSERVGMVQDKVDDYLAFGSQQVWRVYPEKQRIVVYLPDNTSKAYNIGDTLLGGDLLPDFTLDISAVFKD